MALSFGTSKQARSRGLFQRKHPCKSDQPRRIFRAIRAIMPINVLVCSCLWNFILFVIQHSYPPFTAYLRVAYRITECDKMRAMLFVGLCRHNGTPVTTAMSRNTGLTDANRSDEHSPHPLQTTTPLTTEALKFLHYCEAPLEITILLRNPRNKNLF